MAAAAALVIPAAMAIIILLLNPTTCDALTSFNPLFNTNPLKHGPGVGKEKDLIGDQDMESEFLMESHMISRILQTSQPFHTSETTGANEASVRDCGRPPRNDSCLGTKTSNPRPENCGAFNRENPC